MSHFESDISFLSEKFHKGTRQWILADISSWQKRPLKNRNELNACLIIANPGMGKSVLAGKLCAIYKKDATLAGCFFFQHHLGRRSNAKMLIQALCHQFQSTIAGYSAIIQDEAALIDPETLTTFEIFSYLIIEPLACLPSPPQNMAIVVDALDECDFDSRSDLLKLLRSYFIKLPPWIQVILTTRPDKKILQFLKKIKTTVEIKPDDPRNLNDIQLFLNDFLREKMSNEEFDSGVALLIEKSEGMFLYFQYAIDTLEEKEYVSLEELKDLLPDGIDEYYEHNFSRLFDALGPQKYQILLQGILIARSNLPQSLVAPMLGVTTDEANKIVSMVSTLLPIHNGLISIFHKSVRDWLLDKELAGKYVVDEIAGHKQLATVCRQELVNLKANHELVKNPVYQFVVQNVIHHAAHGLSASLVLETVQDLLLLYFHLVYNQGVTTELLNDLDECLTIVSKNSRQIFQAVRQCHEFIRRHTHILEGKPSLVFQCALNEPTVFAERLGIKEFVANPFQITDLKLLLQVQNKSEQFISPLATFSSDDDIRSCTLTPDSKLVIFSDVSGFVYSWDVQTGEILEKFDLSNEFQFPFGINTCSVSPDQQMIAYGNPKQVLSFDGEKIPLVQSDIKCEINTCIFSPQGDKIVTFAFYEDGLFRLLREIQIPMKVDFYLQLWDVHTSTNKTLKFIKREESRPMCACFSPDGQKVFCGFRNGIVGQWDTDTSMASAFLLSSEVVIREGKCPYCLQNE